MIRRSLVAAAVLFCACNADKPTSSSTPTVVKPGITWPQAADTRGPSLLGEENAKLVARSPVPVLVPDTRVEQPVLIVEAEYYAFSGKMPGGVSLAIQGTRKAYRHADMPPMKGERPLRGTTGYVTINEGIRVVTWSENGAAYSVDVECADHRDERCAKEDFAVGLTNRLVYVGGSGR